MGDRTSIEWTDASWNPVTGCTKVSPGCDHCYAETIAHRFAGTKAYPAGFAVTLRPERLDQPIRWARTRRVFVNSMSDLFHRDVPDDYIAQVWARMAASRRHTFQVLTKRPARMRALLRSANFVELVHRKWIERPQQPPSWRWPLPNVWGGVSVESQQWAENRIPILLDTPLAIRFVSAEPLLGPLDLAGWLHDSTCAYRAEDVCTCYPPYEDCIDWVIAGGESGTGARPMHPDWARSLRDQCATSRAAFHFKQWGEWYPGRVVADDTMSGGAYYTGSPVVGGQLAVSSPNVHDFGGGVGAYRIGKRLAGRELDGRTWDEYPPAVAR